MSLLAGIMGKEEEKDTISMDDTYLLWIKTNARPALNPPQELRWEK